MNLCFFVHDTPAKVCKKGLYPLKVQLDVNGGRVQFTVPRLRVHPSHWEHKMQRINPIAPDSYYINTVLDNVKERYNRIRLDAEKRGKFTNVQEVKSLLLQKSKPCPDIFGMIDHFLRHQKLRCETGKIVVSSYKMWAYKCALWRTFLKHEGIKYVQEVRKSTQDALGLFTMRNNAHSKNPNNLAWIAVHSFKAFLNYCLDNEWIERNPFTKSDWKYQKPTKVYLEEAEIQKLRSLDLSNNPRLAQARDLFLFSCATGVAYSDLTKIQKKDIQVFENELYLFVERQKTGVKGFIPLTEEAHQILVEYGYCLPITRYRTYNNNLQEIRALSGINKKITTHIGRKTFANIMLNVHNTPLEVVSKMMCHAEMETTALYYTEVSLAKVHQNTKHLFFNS